MHQPKVDAKTDIKKNKRLQNKNGSRNLLQKHTTRREKDKRKRL